MKPILFHGKRPRPEGQEQSHPPKRPRVAETPNIALTNQCQLSSEHQEVIRILEHNVQQHSSILDLSMFYSNTLLSLPLSMVSTLVGQVKSLILPDGMPCVPLFCNAMPELQALHAPDFNGVSLDLSGMRNLRNLTGNAGRALKEIHLPATTDINFHSYQKLHKIRVWRYQEGHPPQQHPLPSHTYFKILPGKSAPDFSELNFMAKFSDNNETIVCRHLSNYVLEQLLSPDFDLFSTEGYLGLTDAETLPQKIPSAHEERFNTIFSSSKHYHIVDDANFANWASAQFLELECAATLSGLASSQTTIKKGFMAVTSNHVLVCMLAIKPGPVSQYAIVMYDPNDGLTHQRRVANSIEELTQRKWRFTDLITSSQVPDYFAPGHQPLLCLIEPEQRAANALPITHFAIETTSLLNKDLLYDALSANLPGAVTQIGINLLAHYRAGGLSAQAIFETLKGRKDAKFPWCSAIEVATYSANPQIVTAVMALLKEFALAVSEKAAANASATDGLAADFYIQLLKSAAGWDSVSDKFGKIDSLALEELCNKTMELVSESFITGEQAAALLLTSRSNGFTYMEIAIFSNASAILRTLGIYLTALFEEKAIDFESCLMLLDQPDPLPTTSQNPMASLTLTAAKQGWSDTLEVYADLLIKLANVYTKKVGQAAILLNDRITEQLMGPVSVESVEAIRMMMRAPEDGELLRTTLQQFLMRLTDAGILRRDNVLSELCQSKASQLTVSPQTEFNVDDFFLDDRQVPL